uniref:Pseudouridine synthase RsuA/RluA-like domain-containing protein n=1 Tax=Ditylum brightwellii TaxID=49249 RepID=A0A6V2G5C6_9STRA
MKRTIFFVLLFVVCFLTTAFQQQPFRRQWTHRSLHSHVRELSATHHSLPLFCRTATGSTGRKALSNYLWYRETKQHSTPTDVIDATEEADEMAYDSGDADDDKDATCNSKIDEDSFFDEAERDAERMSYPKGKPEGYHVTKLYTIPDQGFMSLVTVNNTGGGNSNIGITQEEVDRLGISGTNITLPIALMLLDIEEYPSLSRARKSCRKGNIVVNRGPLVTNSETGKVEFDQETCFKGRVIDRVYPGDVIGIQYRLHGGYYPGFDTHKPPFEVPVVYEDDHFAIVNKPAGIVCYSQRDDSHGIMTIRHALPFALKPPKRGTSEIYRRPLAVHRLDKPTSGLLIVAKTKPALVNLSNQFEQRIVKKTYTAIVNGIPSEPLECSITAEEALILGVDLDTETDGDRWQLIDHTLDGKSAVTVWRPLKYGKSLKAKDSTLTLVELKPKTGRRHQLRRHMSEVKECPLVGDTTYDGGGSALRLRGRGLFLCSNRVRLEHPYYNTVKGREEWDALPASEKCASGKLSLSDDGSTVEVHASIDLPDKFLSFLGKETGRHNKFGAESS